MGRTAPIERLQHDHPEVDAIFACICDLKG